MRSKAASLDSATGKLPEVRRSSFVSRQSIHSPVHILHIVEEAAVLAKVATQSWTLETKPGCRKQVIEGCPICEPDAIRDQNRDSASSVVRRCG